MMLSEGSSRRIDAEGYMPIDRSGKHFEKILNFLRDGSIPLPDTRMELEELLSEAKFYQIQELINRIEREILSFDKPCRDKLLAELAKKVIVFTSVADENDSEKLNRRLSKMTDLCFRIDHVSSSGFDGHLLANLKLFERLFRDFGRKVLFLKDLKSGDLCKWDVIEDGKCTKTISCDENGEIQCKQEDVCQELSRICINHYMD
ncbi:BTB/POZ domain-containing adapter for CUL3-mediated RhoA degradation protein 3-like [Brevipalpus obovatus]|uniref:BTB/POZ domain-containing adapter for CUL3-mediated RhoA degradation protein 3-like n=1 Tax=Brevipalpus obovatus TaxID=246614 RepID=UPI003D9DB1D6